MEFNYILTKSELVESYTRLTFRCLQRSARTRRPIYRFGTFLISAVGGLSLFVVFRESFFGYGIICGIVGLAAFALIFNRFSLERRINKQIAHMFRLLSDTDNNFAVVVDKSGISALSEGLSQSFRWAYLDEIVETPFGLEVDALGSTIFLPERLFHSPAEKSEVKQKIESLRKPVSGAV